MGILRKIQRIKDNFQDLSVPVRKEIALAQADKARREKERELELYKINKQRKKDETELNRLKTARPKPKNNLKNLGQGLANLMNEQKSEPKKDIFGSSSGLNFDTNQSPFNLQKKKKQ